MEPVPQPIHLVPNTRIPKVLGILNIVFASMLMICGLCSISYYASIPLFTNAMTNLQTQVKAKEAAERKAVLEKFEEDEKAATTDEEKESIRLSREEYEAVKPIPQPAMPDLRMMGLDGADIQRYVWTEFLSGLLLNLGLLTAGIGLVMQRPWGLKLGLGVAALKIVRLFMVYGYAALVIAPKVSLGMAKMQMQQMEQLRIQQGGKPLPPGLDVETLTRLMTIWMTSCAVAMIIFGMIFPVISLWLLSRPRVKAACSGLPESMGKASGQDGLSW